MAAEDARWAYFYPPAPTGLGGTPGNTLAELSWTAGSGNIGPPITDYSIQYSANSGSSWTTFSDGTSAVSTASVTGLSNNTSYLFRVAAINGIGTGSYSSNSSSVTPTAGDPYFSYVSLLLHADGTNATFVDSSNIPKNVIVGGSATQSATQSRFGGKSAKLANGDHLSVISSTVLVESADYVLEFWIYPLTQTENDRFFVIENSNGDSRGFIKSSNTSFQWNIFGVPTYPLTGNLTNNQWQHVALVKSGSTTSLYIDGTRTSTTMSTIFPPNPTRINWGASVNNYAYAAVNAYYDDIRITLNTDRGYTGSTITVPTEAFSNVVADGQDPYFAQVPLLLHMDGTGGSFVDSGPFPKSLTSNGSAVQSATQSKWGGKSLFVEDSSKYVSLSSTDIVLSGDFAMECWVYMLGSASSYVIVEGRNNTAAYEDFVWYLHNGGYNGFVNAGGGGTRLDGTTALVPQNQWCHIAISREGSTIRAYVNGVKDATTASYGSAITASSATLKIGSNGSQGQGFYGYIDDFRLTNGYHRGYTGSTITLPTAAFLDS